MDARELRWVESLWSQIYPKEVFSKTDPRLNDASYFRNFFRREGSQFLDGRIIRGDSAENYVNISVPCLAAALPDSADLEGRLRTELSRARTPQYRRVPR